MLVKVMFGRKACLEIQWCLRYKNVFGLCNILKWSIVKLLVISVNWHSFSLKVLFGHKGNGCGCAWQAETSKFLNPLPWAWKVDGDRGRGGGSVYVTQNRAPAVAHQRNSFKTLQSLVRNTEKLAAACALRRNSHLLTDGFMLFTGQRVHAAVP